MKVEKTSSIFFFIIVENQTVFQGIWNSASLLACKMPSAFAISCNQHKLRGHSACLRIWPFPTRGALVLIETLLLLLLTWAVSEH